MCQPLPDGIGKKYYQDLFLDYNEMKGYYPFSKIFVPPTIQPREAKIVVIAAGRDLIENLHAVPEDFTNEYSKLIEVVVPHNYKKRGCRVYGGAWIDVDRLKSEDKHFFERLQDGRFQLCVGAPSSFAEMKNVILECIRTTDHYLVAYEKYQRGLSKKLELISYSHGVAGEKQYVKDKKRYRTRQ